MAHQTCSKCNKGLDNFSVICFCEDCASELSGSGQNSGKKRQPTGNQHTHTAIALLKEYDGWMPYCPESGRLQFMHCPCLSCRTKVFLEKMAQLQ